MPSVGRSADAGQSYASVDTSELFGLAVRYILQVDPAEPALVYLRLRGTNQRDQFAIYRFSDGLVAPALALGSTMTAFLHRSDGALLVSNRHGVSFISTDAGRTVGDVLHGLHVRALAERDGKVYVAADTLQATLAAPPGRARTLRSARCRESPSATGARNASGHRGLAELDR